MILLLQARRCSRKQAVTTTGPTSEASRILQQRVINLAVAMETSRTSSIQTYSAEMTWAATTFSHNNSNRRPLSSRSQTASTTLLSISMLSDNHKVLRFLHSLQLHNHFSSIRNTLRISSTLACINSNNPHMILASTNLDLLTLHPLWSSTSTLNTTTSHLNLINSLCICLNENQAHQTIRVPTLVDQLIRRSTCPSTIDHHKCTPNRATPCQHIQHLRSNLNALHTSLTLHYSTLAK